MIRYYERHGIINPLRTESNYREYSALDQFCLLEAAVMSKFNTNIQQTGKVKQENYSIQMYDHLNAFISETKDHIRYEENMIRRAEERIGEIDEGIHNLNRVWIKKIPAEYRLACMHSHHDDYDEVLFPEEMKKLFVSEKDPCIS